MEKMKNVPEIRFEGFEGEWNKKELDDEVNFYSGLTYSPKDVQKESGTFVIRSSNVKNNRLVEADDVFVNPDIVNSQNVEQGDIAVVVRNGSRHLIGKHAQITTKLDNTVIGAFMTGLRPKNNSDFVNALLNTQSFQKEIEKNLGATINQITTGPFKKMEFFFPEPKEQIVIGDFVKNLNNSILETDLKLEKLTNLKKAMLIKMFPQDGASVPEIRFKGFDGEWEEKPLSSEVEIVMGQSPDSKNYTENPKDHILVQGNADLKDAKVEPRLWTTQVTKKAEKGDLIFTVRAPVGDMAKTDFDIVIGRGVAAIRGNDFVFQTLKRAKEFEYWYKYSAGSTFDSINSEQLKNASFYFPCSNEQEKIGTYFKNLDDLISNHKEQLKKLNQITKACLTKLFVSQD